MIKEGKISYRYSHAFKQKVVSEVESGKLSICQARKLYDIGGAGIIQQWAIKYGKKHLLNKVVRIEMRDEKDKYKELKKREKELESALARAHLKIIALESLVETAEEHYKIDIKKKSGFNQLKGRSTK